MPPPTSPATRIMNMGIPGNNNSLPHVLSPPISTEYFAEQVTHYFAHYFLSSVYFKEKREPGHLIAREFLLFFSGTLRFPKISVPQWDSAGWQVINFHRRLLGNFYHFWYFDPCCLDEEKLREHGEEKNLNLLIT